MKKNVSIVLCIALLAGIVACAPVEQSVPSQAPTQEIEPSQTPAPESEKSADIPDGVYEGDATGYSESTITVAVTIRNNAITNVEILDHGETYGVGDLVVQEMPTRIVEEQSYNLDAYSGATISSYGIKNAVKNALEAAGAVAGMFDAAPEKDTSMVDKTIDIDIAIAGSGIAGLSAAIKAAESGCSVVVFEKLSHAGGNSRLSGGAILATGSPINKDEDDDPEDLAKFWQWRSNGNGDPEMQLYCATRSGEAVEFLMEHGVEFNSSALVMGTSTKPRDHFVTVGSGGGFILPLVESAGEKGVEIIYNTSVTELITDIEGAIVGFKAKSDNVNYTVNAKAVILATGGYDADPAMKAQYSPSVAEVMSFSSVGNVGDGLIMGMAVGADTVFKDGYIGFKTINPALKTSSGINGISWRPTLGVTEDGERFQDEGSDYPIFCANLLEVGKQTYFINDSASSAVDLCETAAGRGFAYKADTLEELAGMFGADPAVFIKTVERYNELAAKGVDEDFGRKDELASIAQAPFYATKIQPAIIGSIGGLKITNNAEVVSTDGSIIPGLYAAGAVANGQIFDSQYPLSGSMIAVGSVYGMTAGEVASAKILSN